MANDRLMPLPELEKKIGFKSAKIYNMIREGSLPQGKMIQGKRLWRESEIDAWIEAQWANAS
jgi:predicted DNA-binding transcriptional regulator AlpA